jgi:hypothetical protein
MAVDVSRVAGCDTEFKWAVGEGQLKLSLATSNNQEYRQFTCSDSQAICRINQ